MRFFKPPSNSVQISAGLVSALVLTLAVQVMAATSSQSPPPAQRPANQSPSALTPPPARTPRSLAPVDLTGFWVSVVTEDWRWRMLTPPKGDYASMPLLPAGQKIADQWDQYKDAEQGLGCKAYGAAGLMRMPTRLQISWVDDATLQVLTDAGQQKRLLWFDQTKRPPEVADWQGHSLARWLFSAPVEPGSAARGQRRGYLGVVTTNMRSGYLRKNGVPYSENARLTEYLDLVQAPSKLDWLIVTVIVEDPAYLYQPYVTSSHFRREPDDSRWSPSNCNASFRSAPPGR